MKKFLLPAALVAVLALGSCSGKGSATGDTVADFKSKIENCTNTDSIQAYVGQAQQYVQKLVDEGKIDEAKKYLEQIEPVVKEKAPKFAGAFEAVKSFVDKVPSAGEDALDKAKDAAAVAGDSIGSAVENVKEAAAEKVSDVKDAVSDKAGEVKDAVSQKASDVKDAVSDKAGEVKDAVSKKASDVKDAVSDKAGEVKDAVSKKTSDITDAAKDKVHDLFNK